MIRLIGQRWKRGNMWSWLILIVRGLNQILKRTRFYTLLLHYLVLREWKNKFSSWKIWKRHYNKIVSNKWSGNYGEKVTPVPIPNTEVKLLSANGSWDTRPCESRTLPGTFKDNLKRLSFCVFLIKTITIVKKYEVFSKKLRIDIHPIASWYIIY